MRGKPQRIKLRQKGSAVKLDGTLIDYSPDGKRVTVRFDARFLEDKVLYFWSNNLMVDRDPLKGKPSEHSDVSFWEVL